jgi:hypothetical protein
VEVLSLALCFKNSLRLWRGIEYGSWISEDTVIRDASTRRYLF